MSCCRNILNVARGSWLFLTLERKVRRGTGNGGTWPWFSQWQGCQRRGRWQTGGAGEESGTEGALVAKSATLEARSVTLVTRSTTSLPRSAASRGLWALWWSWFGTRLGVRCWLVVSGTGFACGYGGNEKVRVSVRERASKMKKEHFPKTVLKSKPLLNTCVQRRFFENRYWTLAMIYKNATAFWMTLVLEEPSLNQRRSRSFLW